MGPDQIILKFPSTFNVENVEIPRVLRKHWGFPVVWDSRCLNHDSLCKADGWSLCDDDGVHPRPILLSKCALSLNSPNPCSSTFLSQASSRALSLQGLLRQQSNLGEGVELKGGGWLENARRERDRISDFLHSSAN